MVKYLNKDLGKKLPFKCIFELVKKDKKYHLIVLYNRLNQVFN